LNILFNQSFFKAVFNIHSFTLFVSQILCQSRFFSVQCNHQQRIFVHFNFPFKRYFHERAVKLPVMISGTITDASGRTLSGQTVEAFLNSVRHAEPVSIGLNCALGARELRQHMEELSSLAETFVSAYPNAGLPNAFGGYDETPGMMAEEIREWAESGFLNIVGGCCGTTPEFITAIAESVAGVAPRTIPVLPKMCRLSGLEPLNIGADSLFANIGERANVAGSARFKRFILEERYDEALSVCTEQVENGAQIIDVREPEEYDGPLGHIRGAILIPLDELGDRIDEIDHDKPVVTVCRAGGRSAHATQILQKAGFSDVANLAGGMLRWRSEGHPAEGSVE